MSLLPRPIPSDGKRCPRRRERLPLTSVNHTRSMPDGGRGYSKAYEARLHRARQAAKETSVRENVKSGPICLRRLPSTPHVAHEHVTGAVRAVLCFTCNGGLGQFRDAPDVVRRAAAYPEGDVWTPIPVAAGVYRLPS